MIKRKYSSNSREALNVIWNAAGRYDFDPAFLAFYPNGKSDFYFNIIIGLCYKWLDTEALLNFFDSFLSARDADELSEYSWLALENCLYVAELADRPIMSDLRKKRAEDFFKVQQSLSRQQMELMSIPVYNQQQARWAFVSGRRMPLLSTREKRFYEELFLSFDGDTVRLLERLKDILRQFYPRAFTDSRGSKGSGRSPFKKLWGKKQSGKLKNNDHLIIRAGSGLGDPLNAVHLNQEAGFKKDPKKATEDLAYIEACFGKCRYSAEELRGIESIVCTQHDLGCRLWFADALAAGSGSKLDKASGPMTREITNIHKSAAAQQRKNLEFYHTHSLQIRENIRRLTSEIDTMVSSYLKHLPERAVTGRLDPAKAYRLPVFNDADIFLRDGDEAENHLFVDILLDASQSRMNVQETIASEAFVISESFKKAGIPVQILSFRSLRGFTVIENLKSFDDLSSMGVFEYFSAGWNRDAVAFKAVNFLINERLKANAFEKHILLILTDASPNDSTALWPYYPGEKAGNYEGLIPVEDALDAVKELRKKSISTAAIFHGSTLHLENAYQIFGKDYIRIHSLAQLSGGFLDLFERILENTEA